MKNTLIGLGGLLLFLLMQNNFNVFGQESGHEELGIKASKDGGFPGNGSEVIVIEAVSPVWIPDRTSSGFPPVEADTFKFGWSSRISPWSGDLEFAAEVAGGTEPCDFRFAWGKYKITFGEDAYYNNGVLIGYTERYYFYIDFTDTMYGINIYNNPYGGFADFRFDFNWDDKIISYYVPREPDTTWNENTHPTVNIWEYEWIKPNSVSRNTAYLIPPAPKDFSLTASSGSPYLCWSSNGETFPLKYFIYRKLDSGSFSFLDSTTNTYYSDNSLSGAGSGVHTAYYYLKTKNNSSGSVKVSDPSDTLNITYIAQNQEQKVFITGQLPFKTDLHPNYPNPFNPSTVISYQLTANSDVKLTIYNTLGQEVRALVNGTQSEGLHKITWDGKNRYGQAVPSGVYLYRLQTASFTKTMKMILMR